LLQGAVLGRDTWRGGNGAGAADVGGRTQCGGLLGGHGALPGDLGPGKIAMGNPSEIHGKPWETLGKSWDNPWENGENHGKSIGTCYFNPENMVISWDLEPIHRLLSGFFSEIHSKWGIYRDLFTDL